jgi:proteasome accessory factor C
VVDRLERLTDLVLFLREGRPRSLREIANSVPGYPPEGEARRQAFERDKRTLRSGGVEITTVPVEGKDQIGYMIRAEDLYLPDMELDSDEQAALNLAVAGVNLGDTGGRDALWRLGLPASAGAQPLAALPALPALPSLHGALGSGASVSFSYRGEQRHVDPALLRFHGGWWYLVGYDKDRGAPRTFRVDRMEGLPSVAGPGSAELPESFDITEVLRDEPWKMGESEPVLVDVLVDAQLATLVVGQLGETTVAERRDDGSAVVRLEVTNTAACRSWVLELGDHAEVLAPLLLRDEMAAWLDSMVSASSVVPVSEPALEDTRGGPRSGAGGSGRGVTGEIDGQGATAGATGGRADAGQRLHRLLAVLTWLARRGRAPVEELAERFGLSPAGLVADLELAACCGLPPYTPDQLMEIIVDESEVVADLGPDLARSRRLTPAEGFALAVSCRAILSVRGADPEGALGRALGKLESALGGLGSLRVDLGEPSHLEEARRAVSAHEQIELRYYSLSSDEESVRVVDPLDVVAVDGRWYLDGYCHRVEGMRRFRIDRILELNPTGRITGTQDRSSGDRPGTVTAFVPGPDATVVHLAVDEDGSWVTEAVPVISTAPSTDGRTEVVLGVASTIWFERLLLRLGPHAEVLGPPELADAGREAARRLLARYRRP